MLDSPDSKTLLNTRSSVNERLVLVLCDVVKEGRQLAAYSTKRRLGIWQGKPGQAAHPIGPLVFSKS
jgi:hypothetical protein